MCSEVLRTAQFQIGIFHIYQRNFYLSGKFEKSEKPVFPLQQTRYLYKMEEERRTVDPSRCE